jgi:hypothetical protein
MLHDEEWSFVASNQSARTGTGAGVGCERGLHVSESVSDSGISSSDADDVFFGMRTGKLDCGWCSGLDRLLLLLLLLVVLVEAVA